MSRQLFLSGTCGLGKTTALLHFMDFGWTPKHLDYYERVRENGVWYFKSESNHLICSYVMNSFLTLWRHKLDHPPATRFVYDRAPVDDVVYEYIADALRQYDDDWNKVRFNMDLLAGGFRQRLKTIFPRDSPAYAAYKEMDVHVMIANNVGETLERMVLRDNGIDTLNTTYLLFQNYCFTNLADYFEHPRYHVDLLTVDVLNGLFNLTTPTPPESDDDVSLIIDF